MGRAEPGHRASLWLSGVFLAKKNIYISRSSTYVVHYYYQCAFVCRSDGSTIYGAPSFAGPKIFFLGASICHSKFVCSGSELTCMPALAHLTMITLRGCVGPWGGGLVKNPINWLPSARKKLPLPPPLTKSWVCHFVWVCTCVHCTCTYVCEVSLIIFTKMKASPIGSL